MGAIVSTNCYNIGSCIQRARAAHRAPGATIVVLYALNPHGKDIDRRATQDVVKARGWRA
jgi:hypothetical protein